MSDVSVDQLFYFILDRTQKEQNQGGGQLRTTKGANPDANSTNLVAPFNTMALFVPSAQCVILCLFEGTFLERLPVHISFLYLINPPFGTYTYTCAYMGWAHYFIRFYSRKNIFIF